MPAAIDCVASGELEPGFPVLVPAKAAAENRKVYVFTAPQPLRYLAFIVSRFTRTDTVTVAFPPAADDDIALTGLSFNSLNLSVEANPRQAKAGRELLERAADIATFYQSLVGDSPYPSFTVALIESDLAGRPQPRLFRGAESAAADLAAHVAQRSGGVQQLPGFLPRARTRASVVGTGRRLAQLPRAVAERRLRAVLRRAVRQHERGDETFATMLRQMRKWGMDESAQGPVYLGYRLGHIRGDSRVFRALVYNKGAAVLHMLRRLVGDDAFFRGLRRFYRESRFHKAGTEDLRTAMEAETGRPLERFFERWIYGSTLPKLKFSYRVDGADVVLHVEQIGELFDVPVTVTLQYLNQKPVDVVIPVTERTADKRIPLAGTLRSLDISKDDGTLAEIIKGLEPLETLTS